MPIASASPDDADPTTGRLGIMFVLHPIPQSQILSSWQLASGRHRSMHAYRSPPAETEVFVLFCFETET